MNNIKCKNCIHEPVCTYCNIKDEDEKTNCIYFKLDYNFTDKIINSLCFTLVLLAIKLKSCHHLCSTCHYRKQCYINIKEEVKKI